MLSGIFLKQWLILEILQKTSVESIVFMKKWMIDLWKISCINFQMVEKNIIIPLTCDVETVQKTL